MGTRVLTRPEQVEVDDLTPSARNSEAKIRRGISFLADLTRGALPADERSTAALAFIDVLDDDDCAPMLAPDLRAEFVTAVLDLGYPFALHLKPEDLAPVRSTSSRSRRSLAVGLSALVGLVVGFFVATSVTVEPAVAPPSAVVAPARPVVWPSTATSLGGDRKDVNVNPVREASFEPKVVASTRSVPQGVSDWTAWGGHPEARTRQAPRPRPAREPRGEPLLVRGHSRRRPLPQRRPAAPRLSRPRRRRSRPAVSSTDLSVAQQPLAAPGCARSPRA